LPSPAAAPASATKAPASATKVQKVTVLDDSEEAELDAGQGRKAARSEDEAERRKARETREAALRDSQRAELDAELAAAKEAKQQEKKEARRAEEEELRRAEEHEKKDAALAIFGLKRPPAPAQPGQTRMVKRRRKVTEQVMDEDGFLIVRESYVEEEVEELVPVADPLLVPAVSKGAAKVGDSGGVGRTSTSTTATNNNNNNRAAAADKAKAKPPATKQAGLGAFFKKKD
jgi:hypothetical protein